MLFSSPIFLFFFFPVLTLIYSISTIRSRNLVLLIASILFYVWGEKLFFVVMLASIVINWMFGLMLAAREDPGARKLVVTLAVIANIGLLAFFKYSEFLVVSLNQALAMLGGPQLGVITTHLPLGISFFTFHALSYVIDIYRREADAQKNPIDFALYISFFPQLIAGPIIRYHDIYRQLTERRVTLSLATLGTERFLSGLGKKMVLANPLGEVADHIFLLGGEALTAPIAWLGILCYTLQIYLDFSAYSDMAIGLGRLFGFTFLENFNYPYCSQSMTEFWRKWHISLSNWMRDYLYIPLGGNRVGKARNYVNLVLVFFLCGLWHGANWTFVVWGLLHGLFLMLERMGLSSVLGALPRPVRHLYVGLVVVLTWVFFRSADLPSAVHYLGALIGAARGSTEASVMQFVDPLLVVSLVLGALASTPLFSRLTTDWQCRRGQVRGEPHPAIEQVRIGEEGAAVLAVRFVGLAAIAILAGGRIAAGTYNPFIYFRF